MNKLRPLKLAMRHEWRTLIADRSLALVCGLLALLTGYALINGLAATGGRDRAVADVLAREAQAPASNVETLRRIESGRQAPGPFANPANPATIGGGAGRYAVVPTAGLAPVAIGQGDMIPNHYAIGYGSKVSFMFDSEIENPWNLLNGHFDLAFLVNGFGRSSAFNALSLIACWTLLVLVAPVLLNLLVGAVEPAPSRTELTNRTTAIKAENLRRYDELFHGDYAYVAQPNALLAKDGRIEMPPRTRATFLADRDMDARLDALLKRFDEQLRAQQQLIDRLGPVSPAVTAYEGFSSLAGNNSRRYLAFKEQVDAFHDGWRAFFVPRILGGRAMNEAELQSLPRWRWREPAAEAMRGDVAWRIALLLALAGALLALGTLKLRRYTIA